MKTKEELLKIYSAYLPYEIDFRFCHGWSETIMRLHSVCFEKEVVNDNVYLQPKNIEPILYSMDMLTKEIEHKGERFIPTVWLRDNHAEFDISKKDMETLISMFLHIFRSSFSAPHYFIDKLLEWQFNVFGLDESEYVQKESLK
jgi:hypothetical protein